METNIDELEYEDSNITSYNSEYISRNSHLKFHNKPTSFTEFKTHPVDSVKITGVPTPTGVVLHQEFEEQNRKVLLKKIHYKYIEIDIINVILLDKKSTMDQFCNTKLVGNSIKPGKRCAFRVIESRCSSLTRHR